MRRSMRTSRRAFAGVALCVSVLGMLGAAPVWAAESARAGASADPDLSRVEARRYSRWWGGQVVGESLALAGQPTTQLEAAAAQAWAAGVSRQQLEAALFTDVALDVFASNYAGGEGRPSPYLLYFENNPAQLGPLGDLFAVGGVYRYGPGGTQEELFERFPGLRESYLASLGLREVNGRIVDPRAPLLSPYVASLLLGAPDPIRQPAIALNVATS
jgi:hypothetical protein